MTRPEKELYKDAKPVAIYPIISWGGIEILAIEHGYDDYVVYREHYGEEDSEVHRVKIRTAASGRSFFIYNTTRIYLDQCLRVEKFI